MLFESVFSAPQEDYVRLIICYPCVACLRLFSYASQIEQLYSNLGSPRLSTLIREEYKPTDAITNSPFALETRSLVLERLSLFLDEQTQARAAVPYSWLANSDNFLVSEVGRLTLTRTLQFGQIRIVKTQEASATAERRGKGAVRLWISRSSQLDYFE